MNSGIPNLRHLRAFREVGHHRSISRAAKEVHLSQPAITQAIAKLESQLDVSLFQRRSDGMIPTALGGAFLGRVDRAMEFIHLGAKEALRLGGRKDKRGFAHFEQLLTTAQLRALIAVSKARNFSLAARAVGLSQPTLHRAARDLERLSGLSLFVKSPHGIDLTPAAKTLTQAVKLAFAELAQGFAELDEMHGASMGRADTGKIVIGALPLPRTVILPTAINELLSQRPEVRVSVIDGPYNDLLHDLRHGEIDLLVGALRDPLPIEDVVQETLFTDPLAIVARADHPLAAKRPITLQDLASYSWALPRQGTPTRASFERLFENEPSVPTCTIECSSLVLIRGLLLESDRLTLISAHQIRHEELVGVLAPLPFELPNSARPIGITRRRDWRPTITQGHFLKCLQNAGRRATQGYSKNE